MLVELNRDVFADSSGKVARVAYNLGFVHQKLGVKALNETPLGSVVAAPKPEDQELFCRNGLKWAAKIPATKIKATWRAIEKQRVILQRAKPQTEVGKMLKLELDLAARMAGQSCQFMLWQQAVSAGKKATAKNLAQAGVGELRQLEEEFNRAWPLRNKATPLHCTPFLGWRMADYRRGEVVAA